MYTQKTTGWWWGDGSTMKKTCDPEHIPIAFGAFLDEVERLDREFTILAFDPPNILQDVRLGRTDDLAVYTKPMYVAVEVAVPVLTHRDGWEGKTHVACELGFSLPVGYPIVPCVEQCRGDVEVNMAGTVSKQTMKTLSREAHQQVVQLWQGSRGALQSFMVEVARWASTRDLIQFVAAQAVPRPGTLGKSRSRVFLRMHHIVSPVKLQYGLDWGAELGVRGFIGSGQPGCLIAEGDTECVNAFVDRFADVVHWGPIPREIVARSVIPKDDTSKQLPPMRELAAALPKCVAVGGAFNGRNSIDFAALAAALVERGHASCGEQLRELLGVYAHEDGHVDNETREQALQSVAQAQAEKKQAASKEQAAAKKKAKAKKRLQ